MRELARDHARRRELEGLDFEAPAQTRIITVANQKGGVGKTSTAVNVGAGLAMAGLQVLIIDADPQGNTSTALGIDHHAEVPSMYEEIGRASCRERVERRGGCGGVTNRSV